MTSSARSSSRGTPDAHPPAHRRGLRHRGVGRTAAARPRRPAAAAGALGRARGRARPGLPRRGHAGRGPVRPGRSRAPAGRGRPARHARLGAARRRGGRAVTGGGPAGRRAARAARRQPGRADGPHPGLPARAAPGQGHGALRQLHLGPAGQPHVGGVRRLEVRAARPGRRAAGGGGRARRTRHQRLPEPDRDPDAGEGPRPGGQGLRPVGVDHAGHRGRRDPARPRPAPGGDDPRARVRVAT